MSFHHLLLLSRKKKGEEKKIEGANVREVVDSEIWCDSWQDEGTANGQVASCRHGLQSAHQPRVPKAAGRHHIVHCGKHSEEESNICHCDSCFLKTKRKRKKPRMNKKDDQNDTHVHIPKGLPAAINSSASEQCPWEAAQCSAVNPWESQRWGKALAGWALRRCSTSFTLFAPTASQKQLASGSWRPSEVSCGIRAMLDGASFWSSGEHG